MTPQPTHVPTLPSVRRRIVRRKVARLVTPAATPELTENQRIAEWSRQQKPDPFNDVVMGHIEAARSAERQKSLDKGFSWE